MGLLKNAQSGYTFSRSPKAGFSALTSPASSTELFAEIALDVNIKNIAERLFTYEIPSRLKNEVFVGSQVLVPFGRQELMSGYVVSIRDRQRLLAGLAGKSESAAAELPDKTREIVEVLDSNPLFEPAYIDFLYWISEYYLCGVSDVLAAALPAEIGPRMKRMVRLLSGEESKPSDLMTGLIESPALNGASDTIKSILKSAGKSLSIKALKDRSRLSNHVFYSTVAKLKRQRELEIFVQADESPAPKLVSHVILSGQPARTSRQQEIAGFLKQNNGSLPLSRLIEETKCSSETIKRMVNEGILSIRKVDSFRDPLKGLSKAPGLRPELTAAQQHVLNILKEDLHKKLQTPAACEGKDESPWLLHGVTGSGKTEIYMRLIEETLDQGRAALLLVPEISLTPQLAQNLLGRFGEQVAVWHSALSAGERFDTWRRVQAGELKLVLGARSAILAHIPNLGLIILDEEHDSSYKQSSPSPRYSARHLAAERGKRESCLVLLGSATPDAGTYFEARKNGRVLELPERVFKQALPESMLVDMRSEFLAGTKSIVSRPLQEKIAECLDRKEQAILLINRRGYASHVFCQACGYVLSCKHCSVSLVFHNRAHRVSSSSGGAAASGSLSCHHCGFSQAASESCPSCQAPFLKQFGLGTQRVEEEIRFLFPQARILRLDSDVTAHKGAYEKIFQAFVSGEADILIGTQLVAKGLDIAGVTLVGVLAADAAFNLPDFRSLERGFQLLTQVSGRAGRGETPGRVILQTHNTDLPALILSKNQDYHSFIKTELESREKFEYPPFSRLVRILASGSDDNAVQSVLERLAEELSNHVEELDSIKILGPAPCLIERIKGQYRHHLIVKNMMGEQGQKVLSGFLRGRQSPAGVRITVDVDPVDLI